MYVTVLLLALSTLGFWSEDTSKESPQLALLKSLEGDWVQGDAKDGNAPVINSFKITAGGTTVRGIEFPGTGHEMVSLYFEEEGKLYLNHYCVLGNQPRMVAVPGGSPDEIVFKFAGGHNLDPATDRHIHEGRMKVIGGNRLKSEWIQWADGKPMDTIRFDLQRLQK